MAEVTLSRGNRVVIPLEVRQALGAKPGDKLLVVVRAQRVIVLKKPGFYHTAIRGLARRVYPNDHLHEKRETWH